MAAGSRQTGTATRRDIITDMPDARPGPGHDGGIQLRRAIAADADAVGDVWLAAFRATYDFPPAHPDADVRRWLREEIVPRPETFVAVGPEGTVVGFMSLAGGDLEHLYVHPDYHGQGIGSRFVQLAKERRPDGLELYTFQVNGRARRFYERRGFVVEHLGNGEGNEERQPDVRYEWRPGGTSG
jgi:ribosomal protein S18 acetylase RimI-like enzyme